MIKPSLSFHQSFHGIQIVAGKIEKKKKGGGGSQIAMTFSFVFINLFMAWSIPKAPLCK